MNDVIRGLLTPLVNESGKENIHFQVDTADANMYLRTGKYWAQNINFWHVLLGQARGQV
jgi:hypothetical protein